METEFEATFPNIDKNVAREKLKSLGALLKRPEYTQKRVVFNLPTGHEIKGGWLRVRDEGDKTTMSLKVINGSRIEYQESKRELWILDNVEITIDEWPFLEPYMEVEGKSKESVKHVSEKLGFDFDKALFCSVAKLYNLKYGISEDIINNQTPEITFEGKNPFGKNETK